MLSLLNGILNVVDLFVVAIKIFRQLLMSPLNGLSFLINEISFTADVLILVLSGVEQVFKLVSFTGNFSLKFLLLIAIFIQTGLLSDQTDLDIVFLLEACLSLLGVLSKTLEISSKMLDSDSKVFVSFSKSDWLIFFFDVVRLELVELLFLLIFLSRKVGDSFV